MRRSYLTLIAFSIALAASSFAEPQPSKPSSTAAPAKGKGDGPAANSTPIASPAPASSEHGAPAKEKAAAAPRAATEIRAQEAEFDNPTHIGVFVGNVVVVNPQFKMNCDKLTAYLRHEPEKSSTSPGATPPPGKTINVAPAQKDPATAATPAPKPATPAAVAGKSPAGGKGGAAADASGKAGGLDKAIAEGNVVINQDKVNPDGTIEHDVAHAKRANYTADTGDVTLYGKPDAQQGGNQVIALDENTIIILNRSGHMTVHGAHKVLLEDANAGPGDSKK